MRRLPLILLVPVAALMATGCATSATSTDTPAAAPAAVQAPTAASAPAAAPAAMPAESAVVASAALYEVHHENGRIYRFYDFKGYQDFLKTDEVPYVMTKIGEGPAGETVVYGLTKTDASKLSGIPSIDLIEGALKPDAFYGEMMREGRIFVFTSVSEMKAVRETGHPSYVYTDIGSGPNGETVVYVLEKKNAEKVPTETIATFTKLRS